MGLRAVRTRPVFGARHPFRYIGPALDGPEAFFCAFPWTIATDTASRIYVLDTGNHIVRVFDRSPTILMSSELL